MNSSDKRFLKDACVEARTWAVKHETLGQAWDACTNPEWMFWALNKLEYDDPIALRRFACWCVRETPLADGGKVWDLLTDDRSRRAVEIAEAFCDGKATQEQLTAAGAAAWAAARDAAGAAAWDAARAARAARDAAGAAAWAAWDAARAARAARDAAGAAQANALREFIGNPFIKSRIRHHAAR